MTDIYGKGPKGNATRLHAQIVRARGACEACGAEGVRLECAHIISRRYAHTRTDLENAVCLCSADHRYFTDYPIEFASFITRHLGQDKYDELYKKSMRRDKVDWVVEADRLAAIWKAIEVAA